MRRSPYGACSSDSRRRSSPSPSGTNDYQRQYCVDFVGVPGGIPLSDLRVVVGRTVLTSTQGQ